MPIYEYHCKACGHEFEALQKMTDKLLTDCPSCSHPALIKLVSAAGFRLKGGGWYETDFKGGKEKKRNLVGEASDGKPADPKTDAGQKASKHDNTKPPARPATDAP